MVCSINISTVSKGTVVTGLLIPYMPCVTYIIPYHANDHKFIFNPLTYFYQDLLGGVERAVQPGTSSSSCCGLKHSFSLIFYLNHAAIQRCYIQ